MRKFTIEEILRATGGRLLKGDTAAEVTGFAIDSRLVKAGEMFFATRGARNDAHDFLADVIARGCRSLLISEPEKLPPEAAETEGLNVIVAADPLTALQELAAWYLGTLPLKKKIGVTGSVGKTSTRDMLYYAAATTYKTGRNKKNYNSAYGLPLSILEFEPDTEIAVLEMAMDTYGEIRRLADIVRPDIAIITQIAEVNLLSMGCLENILKAKMEITAFFDENSTLIVNSTCPLLTPQQVGGAYRLLSVGAKESDDYQVKDICDFGDKGIKYTLRHKNKEYEIELPTAGAHNAFNASLAIAAAGLIGIEPKTAAAGLRDARLTGKRLYVASGNGIKVIDDTYNACEDSVKSALNTLMATEGGRKVAILGDIIGLAHRSRDAHLEVGRYAIEQGVELLIAIGDEARYYAEGARQIIESRSIEGQRALYFPQKKDFFAAMDGLLAEGDTVLVKASRGMALEEVTAEILKENKKY